MKNPKEQSELTLLSALMGMAILLSILFYRSYHDVVAGKPPMGIMLAHTNWQDSTTRIEKEGLTQP